MTPSELLDALFAPLPGAGPPGELDMRAFLKQHGPATESEDRPTYFGRLVRVGLHADRRSAASAAGHQAAIRRLFPATPDDAVVAFCVSEDQGPRPAHIHTTLIPVDGGAGFVMNGTKKWGSMAPQADVRYIAASVGHEGDRNLLRMVALPSDRPGVTIDTEPYVDWGPEMRICDLAFDDVAVRADEIYPEDAYLEHIKPFRLVEDVYNTAGTQVGLLQLGRRHGWPDVWLEELVGLILRAGSLAETDLASPAPVLALTDYLRSSEVHWTDLWRRWQEIPDGVPEQVAAAWIPERGLLGVAAKAREIRRERAWAELRAGQ